MNKMVPHSYFKCPFFLLESLNIFLIVFIGGCLKEFKLPTSVLCPFIYQGFIGFLFVCLFYESDIIVCN